MADISDALQDSTVELEMSKQALPDEIDNIEQYSRRNCLLVQGVSDDDNDTSEAVNKTCCSKLGLTLNRDVIDRSHRLGPSPRATTGRDAHNRDRKPRPIIIKLKDYDVSYEIFMTKRELEGCKIVITENVTKRRS